VPAVAVAHERAKARERGRRARRDDAGRQRPPARTAELGVGTNDRATLTGNTLEDEKILGTAHIAFGASAGVGGTVTVPGHEDVVVLEPGLWTGATQVLDAGAYLLG
jgi:leucyl aminopeptidase (aminopeptidase T)